MVNNLILLPAQVNRSKNVWFILDTGVSNNLILDYSLITISQSSQRKVMVSGLGNEPPIEGILSPFNILKFPKLRPK